MTDEYFELTRLLRDEFDMDHAIEHRTSAGQDYPYNYGPQERDVNRGSGSLWCEADMWKFLSAEHERHLS